MIPTVSVGKSRLSRLPDEVLRLVGMGQYTLYRVDVKDQPSVRYVLRTGERQLFFLQDDGEPIYHDPQTEFNIQEKVTIEDVSVTLAVPNFNRF